MLLSSKQDPKINEVLNFKIHAFVFDYKQGQFFGLNVSYELALNSF